LADDEIFLAVFICNPNQIFRIVKGAFSAARGRIIDWGFDREWLNQVIPESNAPLRHAHQGWALTLVFGHFALGSLFIATGHWFLILVFDFGGFYCNWLALLCGMPQHIGMSPDVPDFRLNSRTYSCSWFSAFLYWNMQYHIEHHMFPSVPFYNLPKLRKAIEYDLPPATHGLWATWKELLLIVKKQREDSSYVFIPFLPQTAKGANPMLSTTASGSPLGRVFKMGANRIASHS
jgi:fatty acid desaturase